MNGAETGICEAKTPGLAQHRPSLETELQQKEERLEAQLKDVRELQKLLKDNPTLSQMNNLLLKMREI